MDLPRCKFTGPQAPLFYRTLRGSCWRGTLWRSNLFDNVPKASKLEEIRHARFAAPTCLVSTLWFSGHATVSMGEAAKPLLFEGSKQVVISFCVAGVALCDVPTCLITCRKCQNWRKSDMLVLLLPRVSSGLSGFPGTSPCLWGKLPNLSFSKVSKQVVMSFCVADVALCDIPTCLITCRKCRNWRNSEMLVLLLPRVSSRLSGFLGTSPCLWGKLPSISILKVSKQVVMSFCVASVALCDIPTCFIPCRFFLCGWHGNALYTLHSTLYTPHSTLHTPQSTLYTSPHSTLYTHHTPHSTLYTLHSALPAPHFTLHTPYFTLRTPHSTRSTPHSALYTLHSTLLTFHSTLHTLHFPLHTADW